MESSSSGQGDLVGDVVAAVAVLLVLGAGAVIWGVMFRASQAQRARTKRKDFGGRYTDFGFLLGALSGRDRSRGEGEATPGTCSADRDGRSTR
jgi:hypothetical protein